MQVRRTPEERFQDLPDYPFEPHYAELSAPDGDTIRMHYVDEGPPDGPPVLLIHGNPEWSFTYRRLIPRLAAEGFRAIAPDNIGFGKSDKPVNRLVHSLPRHAGWHAEFVAQLDLRNVTAVCQDWGGTIGLGAVAQDPDRYARVMVTNAFSPTVEPVTGQYMDELYGIYALNKRQVVVGRASVGWLEATQRMAGLSAGMLLPGLCTSEVPPEIVAAYDAPFPDEDHITALRQMPNLIPLRMEDEGAVMNRETMNFLAGFERPFLTVYGGSDRASIGWERFYQERVPGAKGQPHAVLEGAGHFLTEDRPEEFAEIVVDFARGKTG